MDPYKFVTSLSELRTNDLLDIIDWLTIAQKVILDAIKADANLDVRVRVRVRVRVYFI